MHCYAAPAAQTDPFREAPVRQEGAHLFDSLRDISEKPPAQMAGDLLEAPAGLSLRHLSRKLTRSIYSKAVSDLWRRRTDLEDTLRHQWLHNLLGDNPTQPERSWTWRVAPLGLCQRLGYPASGTGQRRGRTPPPGTFGRHAACCTKGLHTRRHDHIRDLITKLARQAGLTATTEQAMFIQDQIMPDGQPAPGSVRPIHSADVHITEVDRTARI